MTYRFAINSTKLVVLPTDLMRHDASFGLIENTLMSAAITRFVQIWKSQCREDATNGITAVIPQSR